jgi:carbonic anhydrase
VALGRIILESRSSIPRPRSSYRIVEALSRYDCASRSYSTLKRSYFKDEGELLREEDVKVQVEMPVRTGMLDDKLLREVCRPKAGGEAAMAASRTADKVNEASGELRKANEALVQKEVRRANLQTPAIEKADARSQARSARQAVASGKRAGHAERGHWQRPSQPPAGRPALHPASRDYPIVAGNTSGSSTGPTRVRPVLTTGES